MPLLALLCHHQNKKVTDLSEGSLVSSIYINLVQVSTEIESLNTQLQDKDTEIAQQNTQLEDLKEIMKESDEKHQRELAIKDQEVQRTITMLTGVEGDKVDIPNVMRKSENAKAEVEESRGQINALEAEINKLIKLTETEPQYQIFWFIFNLRFWDAFPQ